MLLNYFLDNCIYLDLISSNSSQRTLRWVGEVANAFQAVLGVCCANHVRIRRHVGAD
jgi:hypothetical protein